MPKKKLNSTEEKLALFLHEHEDTRYPQDDIAKLMKVSPSTISRTIKEENIFAKFND